MSYTRREFGALMSGALAAGAVGETPVLTALGAQAPAAASPAAPGRCWTSPTGATSGTASSTRRWPAERSSTGRKCMSSTGFPRAVRHPFAIVLIHGGYGQGTDWISTPDGRRGWASQFLEQGYKVYVVDRPGQGRNPHHPFVHGLNDPQAPTFEGVARRIGALGPSSHAVAGRRQRGRPGDCPGGRVARAADGQQPDYAERLAVARRHAAGRHRPRRLRHARRRRRVRLGDGAGAPGARERHRGDRAAPIDGASGDPDRDRDGGRVAGRRDRSRHRVHAARRRLQPSSIFASPNTVSAATGRW